jgi:pSer/pThr/pTyr-binding forkhead associated (FHA) protein
MSMEPNGELIPLGGGDNIPLIREKLTVGRRESCDICLHLPNVSGLHCELFFDDGLWWIRDLNSTNGIKVNDMRVARKMLRPEDEITIGKRKYKIDYDPPAGSKRTLEAMMEDNPMSQSLLEKAGLVRPRRDRDGNRADPGRFDFDDDDED